MSRDEMEELEEVDHRATCAAHYGDACDCDRLYRVAAAVIAALAQVDEP